MPVECGNLLLQRPRVDRRVFDYFTSQLRLSFFGFLAEPIPGKQQPVLGQTRTGCLQLGNPGQFEQHWYAALEGALEAEMTAQRCWALPSSIENSGG